MNDEFKNNDYMLVKVRYNTSSGFAYTYAAKKELKLQKGDFVVVRVGAGKGIDSIQVAEVGATTENVKKHIPYEFQIKEVLDKVEV